MLVIGSLRFIEIDRAIDDVPRVIGVHHAGCDNEQGGWFFFQGIVVGVLIIFRVLFFRALTAEQAPQLLFVRRIKQLVRFFHVFPGCLDGGVALFYKLLEWGDNEPVADPPREATANGDAEDKDVENGECVQRVRSML